MGNDKATCSAYHATPLQEQAQSGKDSSFPMGEEEGEGREFSDRGQGDCAPEVFETCSILIWIVSGKEMSGVSSCLYVNKPMISIKGKIKNITTRAA